MNNNRMGNNTCNGCCFDINRLIQIARTTDYNGVITS